MVPHQSSSSTFSATLKSDAASPEAPPRLARGLRLAAQLQLVELVLLLGAFALGQWAWQMSPPWKALAYFAPLYLGAVGLWRSQRWGWWLLLVKSVFFLFVESTMPMSQESTAVRALWLLWIASFNLTPAVLLLVVGRPAPRAATGVDAVLEAVTCAAILASPTDHSGTSG
jgi:hypothetical protein